MPKLKNIKSLPVLMVLTIIAIASFQYYWLKKAYEREERTLERQTNMYFAETVFSLQASKLKLDKIVDSSKTTRVFISKDSAGNPVNVMQPVNHNVVSMMNVVTQKIKDSSFGTMIIKQPSGGGIPDTIKFNKAFPARRDRLMQFMFDVDSFQDSIKIRELEVSFAKRLDKENIEVPFTIKKVPSKDSKDRIFNEVTLGFQNPITYRLDLGKTNTFLLKRIGTPILFSFFLVGFTILSFSLLYRNLLRQRRLGDIKNEFISNITHELKTPIATVSVAIEALRSFNATMDPQRTKEYLDISANELQRLSLLVDKVLKLSMFEKKEIELRYEPLDMQALVKEVVSSMRLQFEKYHAEVKTDTEGETSFEGDRLHLVSVIFNLLDNALKYSKDQPKILIGIRGTEDKLILSVTDSGIGIPQEYHGKVFEKFFRVPTGNLHNAKGYGLGLSYVAHVVTRHKGTIKVESIEGNGTKFIISLPKHNGVI
jgi:two-component system, OmpR family, phosphate regulon sensor histidine kinase PhoR